MRRSGLLTAVIGGAAGLALITGLAQASHVKVGGVVTVPPPAAVGAPTLVVPQTLQVEEIKADQVRAHTIYANRIEADQVQGLVQQTGGIKIRGTRSEIKAPEVTASVIYADTITANLVVAEAVYVRDLKIR